MACMNLSAALEFDGVEEYDIDHNILGSKSVSFYKNRFLNCKGRIQ